MVEPVAEHQFQAEPVEGDLLGAGVRLHYLDWGPAPGPTILFLHGGGLTAHTWDVVCDLLRPEYRCLALDLRGHGDSEWSREGAYGLDMHAADVAAAVDWLRLDRFVLVGMSLGGGTALVYAGSHSAHLRGLVLVDTGAPSIRARGRARLRDFVEGPDEHATIEEFVDRAVAFNPLRRREVLRRSLLFNLRRTPHGTWTWKYDRHLRQTIRAEDPASRSRAEARARLLGEAIGKVACPTLVVRGGSSDIFLDEDAERTVAALPHGRWVKIEGAGHTVQGDRPYELTAALREFLTRDVGAAAPGGSPAR